MTQTHLDAQILSFPSTLKQPIGYQRRGPGRLPRGVVSIKSKLKARRVKLRCELSEKESELQVAVQHLDELTKFLDRSYPLLYGLIEDQVKAKSYVEQLKSEIERARCQAGCAV